MRGQRGRVPNASCLQARKVSILAQQGLHRRYPIQGSRKVFRTNRRRVLTNLYRKVNQREYDHDAADELAKIRKILKFHLDAPAA